MMIHISELTARKIIELVQTKAGVTITIPLKNKRQIVKKAESILKSIESKQIPEKKPIESSENKQVPKEQSVESSENEQIIDEQPPVDKKKLIKSFEPKINQTTVIKCMKCLAPIDDLKTSVNAGTSHLCAKCVKLLRIVKELALSTKTKREELVLNNE